MALYSSWKVPLLLLLFVCLALRIRENEAYRNVDSGSVPLTVTQNASDWFGSCQDYTLGTAFYVKDVTHDAAYKFFREGVTPVLYFGTPGTRFVPDVPLGIGLVSLSSPDGVKSSMCVAIGEAGDETNQKEDIIANTYFDWLAVDGEFLSTGSFTTKLDIPENGGSFKETACRSVSPGQSFTGTPLVFVTTMHAPMTTDDFLTHGAESAWVDSVNAHEITVCVSSYYQTANDEVPNDEIDDGYNPNNPHADHGHHDHHDHSHDDHHDHSHDDHHDHSHDDHHDHSHDDHHDHSHDDHHDHSHDDHHDHGHHDHDHGDGHHHHHGDGHGHGPVQVAVLAIDSDTANWPENFRSNAKAGSITFDAIKSGVRVVCKDVVFDQKFHATPLILLSVRLNVKNAVHIPYQAWVEFASDYSFRGCFYEPSRFDGVIEESPSIDWLAFVDGAFFDDEIENSRASILSELVITTPSDSYGEDHIHAMNVDKPAVKSYLTGQYDVPENNIEVQGGVHHANRHIIYSMITPEDTSAEGRKKKADAMVAANLSSTVEQHNESVFELLGLGTDVERNISSGVSYACYSSPLVLTASCSASECSETPGIAEFSRTVKDENDFGGSAYSCASLATETTEECAREPCFKEDGVMLIRTVETGGLSTGAIVGIVIGVVVVVAAIVGGYFLYKRKRKGIKLNEVS